VNKANNFCLHPRGLLGKSTPVRGLGRRCKKRVAGITGSIVTSTLTARRSKERVPLNGFLTRAVLSLLRRQQSFFEAFGRRLFAADFRPAGKSGETPDARREWNMQTMALEACPWVPPNKLHAMPTRILRALNSNDASETTSNSAMFSRRKAAVAPSNSFERQRSKGVQQYSLMAL
jgi:hypothetical protein